MSVKYAIKEKGQRMNLASSIPPVKGPRQRQPASWILTAAVFAFGLAAQSGLFAQTGKTNRIYDEEDKKNGQTHDPAVNVEAKKDDPATDAQQPVKKETPATNGNGTPATWKYDDNHFNQNKEEKKRLIDRIQWQAKFWTSYNFFNNTDLRAINETNQTSIDNTDDRMMFALAGAELDTFFPIHPRLDVRIDVWRTGFWGHDMLGGRDTNNDSRSSFNGANTLNFGLLYLDAHIFTEPTNERRLDLRVGRQEFKIGGEIDRDFLQKDVVDAVVVKWYSKWLGRLDVLLVDWFASTANTQNIYFTQYVSFDNERVKGFNGDTNTFRSGFVYRYPIFGDADKLGTTYLDARGFYFFARYGGVNDGGADRTNNGTTGNFPDNDYVYMRGVRVLASWSDLVRGSVTYASSYGQDRKRQTALFFSQDVDMNGQSWGWEAELSLFDRMILVTPTYYYSQGGSYYADGAQYSHGFVGFKGDQVGGIITQLNWGLYPSAYTDDDGIDDWPYDRDRKTGTEVYHLGVAFGKRDVYYLKLDWWRLRDTNRLMIFDGSDSTLDQNARIAAVAPTFSNRMTQLQAARRFGAPLGEEFNFGVEWYIVPKVWKFWAVAGVFRPMRYFATPGLKQGTPEGSARASGFQMGTTVTF